MVKDNFELKVDYHMHSVYSDGTFTPVELVKKYSEKGYDEVALTDHDGILGVHDMKVAGEAVKLKVITGVELSTDYLGHNVHLLGYKFDENNKELNDKLNQIREFRHDRNVKLIKKLNDMGYDITMEEIECQSKGGYVGKPNMARVLVEKGYVKDYKEAFDKIFESPEIKSIHKEKISIEDAIQLILNAGGIPVLAHPCELKFLGSLDSEEYWERLDETLKYLKKCGLKGLECKYPKHTEEQTYRYIQLAEKYHLHITRGSDFHGPGERKYFEE